MARQQCCGNVKNENILVNKCHLGKTVSSFYVSGESAALDTLKNAMKALHDFQLITSFHPDGDKDQTKLICLNNENNVKQRLFDLIDLLEHMRE